MKNTLVLIRQLLQEQANETTRETSQRFFKEPIQTYGVKSSEVKKIAKRALSCLKGRSKEEIFSISEDLWRSGFLEEGGIACDLVYSMRRHFSPEDFSTFDRWLDQYIHNWAACDTFCNHSVAAFVEEYPQFIAELKIWAGSENRWKKRAAAVTLIIPARHGLFLPDIFAISELLLNDCDDLVQKGYGWMLKAASEVHPQEVYRYLMTRKDVMPRTAFRYALEKMPKEWRVEAMKK
jgi:3-methyladenine DNA glycosylase AlkD